MIVTSVFYVLKLFLNFNRKKITSKLFIVHNVCWVILTNSKNTFVNYYTKVSIAIFKYLFGWNTTNFQVLGTRFVSALSRFDKNHFYFWNFSFIHGIDPEGNPKKIGWKNWPKSETVSKFKYTFQCLQIKYVESANICWRIWYYFLCYAHATLGHPMQTETSLYIQTFPFFFQSNIKKYV